MAKEDLDNDVNLYSNSNLNNASTHPVPSAQRPRGTGIATPGQHLSLDRIDHPHVFTWLTPETPAAIMASFPAGCQHPFTQSPTPRLLSESAQREYQYQLFLLEQAKRRQSAEQEARRVAQPDARQSPQASIEGQEGSSTEYQHQQSLLEKERHAQVTVTKELKPEKRDYHQEMLELIEQNNIRNMKRARLHQ
ncbi:hypothetical protein LTR47_000709 [Exophiala xenobiotica]|nr:hypothetical protein LTR47_000709 [Exophiala xenobiotica]KAK5350397.1 hypothetical protein LTR61_006372 [Exophiala xenobiotica]KAK5387773.1 hypothetical protein LTR11_001438 [Exophiala xenobiotica]KAK5389133.1 hypothetical protein LTS03_001554 [Exophiala xenobiotica]KAK5433649.1 hypothetical protein LTR18_010599 [Exophiala xenobiotica]